MPKKALLERLDALIWPLAFPADVEALFRSQNVEQQHRLVAFGWLIGVFLYDLFIISDYVRTGAYFHTYVVIRFLLVTPICLIIVWNIWRKSEYYDLMLGLIPTTMVVGLSAALILTEGDYRTHYMFGNLLLMVCGCVIGRPRTQFVAAMVALQVIAYLMVLETTNIIPPESKPVSILFCLSGAVVSILSAYAAEKSMRESFLLHLRVQHLNETLNVQALSDPLTGLANRRCFEQATDRHWADAMAARQPVAIVLLDLDRFKAFNDNYGHSAGDECLKRVAQCVETVRCGTRGLAVRFGGEEILLFLPDTDLVDARRIAETIRRSILDAAIPHPAIGPGVIVSASFGVAAATPESCQIAELVAAADAALYAAKANGRNQVWPQPGASASREANRA
ncbi:GGDEF domain-containing protein [Rhizobium sp. Leaf341]|uniref:GGDEF domain-containing protein n=1 Tax=Rhizobium sp. Leaf341 TaxID=1736344 RepID=UPI0007142C90|nr:GGDEF domain-containing protein [Rhizobium sp. Leaf341]KQR69944.1 hypothetical protein ASG03_04585 [Rhizobium sp. Leaf341]